MTVAAARNTQVDGGSSLHPFLVTLGFGFPVCRLGLASYGRTAITLDDVLSAVDRGVNFLNWQGLAEGASDKDAFPAAVSSLGAHRRSVVVCAQFGARSGAAAATELRSALAALGTDYVDVLTIYYVERVDEWEEIAAPGGALRYLRDARRDGAVRRIGITSHQRTLAAEMAKSGLLDTVMIRYNAAHRGAERDVFPVTQPLGLPVIAYTALSLETSRVVFLFFWGYLSRSFANAIVDLSWMQSTGLLSCPLTASDSIRDSALLSPIWDKANRVTQACHLERIVPKHDR